MTDNDEIYNGKHSDLLARYIIWCGRKWWVRYLPGNPGGNSWNNSKDNVWVDVNGNLHLTIKKVGDTWYSTEIDSSSANFFHGEYKWTVASPILDLDPNIVAAMFFRLDDRNEIDIEATQWGMSGNRLWFSVQPNGGQSAVASNCPDRFDQNVTYRFNWQPSYVHFTVELETGDIIADWHCTDMNTIPRVKGGVAMNMWLMNHLVPIDGREAEMVLSNFTYTPSP